MVNFGPRETVPKTFDDRQFYIHNANVTLMRTTAPENQKLGEEIARKLSSSIGPYKVLLPLRGISAIDAEGKPFWNPDADKALFHAIRKGLPADRVIEIDCHINDPEFAQRADEELSRMMKEVKR
jgi:uncharacterized protein (UPF0261 family)